MDFLTNAIFSTESSVLLGARITTFNPESLLERTSVRLFTKEELKSNYPFLHPMGFELSPDGVLLSDTICNQYVIESAFNYMITECAKQPERTWDITDLVLKGMESDGYVVVNYEQASKKEEEPNKISLKNFRVSKSSFNIFASYVNSEGKYRTFSLLDPTKGDKKMFCVAFPESVDVSEFGSSLQMYGTCEINEQVYILYLADICLSTYYASVGEAFLNYLAYSVGFYNIGEKVMKRLIQTIHPEAKLNYPQEPREYKGRAPRANILIEHYYDTEFLDEVLERLDDENRLRDFFAEVPEAKVTYQWLQRLYSSPWFLNTRASSDINEAIYTSAVNLLQDARRDRLKYSLELLLHRYYIFQQGPMNDSLGIILRGGGVDDKSVKQSNFWVS